MGPLDTVASGTAQGMGFPASMQTKSLKSFSVSLLVLAREPPVDLTRQLWFDSRQSLLDNLSDSLTRNYANRPTVGQLTVTQSSLGSNPSLLTTNALQRLTSVVENSPVASSAIDLKK